MMDDESDESWVVDGCSEADKAEGSSEMPRKHISMRFHRA
jgi:hypothetical protein